MAASICRYPSEETSDDRVSVATASLMLSATHSFAQQRQPDAGDEPGLIADDSVQLDPEFRKQIVLYRTTEPPGTIIIQTSERHLYLIPGKGIAIRYVST